jgi:hypothetical protein
MGINAGVAYGYPSRKFLTVKAGEAITQGNVVTMSQTADDGITVLICGADDIPAGVATTTVASGAALRIQTRGLGTVAIVSDGDTDAGHLLYSAASGEVDNSAIGSITDGDLAILAFGICLAADTGTALAANEYIVTCPNSWWD